MVDIVIDSDETTRLVDFWLRAKLASSEALAAGPYETCNAQCHKCLKQCDPIFDLPQKITDYVEEIRPLIEHLESLQMRRRHDD